MTGSKAVMSSRGSRDVGDKVCGSDLALGVMKPLSYRVGCDTKMQQAGGCMDVQGGIAWRLYHSD